LLENLLNTIKKLGQGGSLVESDIDSLGLIEPTDEEKRNGWTAEKLTPYVKERIKEQALEARIAEPEYQPWGNNLYPSRPQSTDSDYNPHAW